MSAAVGESMIIFTKQIVHKGSLVYDIVGYGDVAHNVTVRAMEIPKRE